jgi:acyl carrier protein
VEYTSRITDFISKELLFDDPEAAVTDETSLLDGVIDSLALMQLVAFLEEEFGVDIDDAEITADHFRTVSEIGRLVAGKVA